MINNNIQYSDNPGCSVSGAPVETIILSPKDLDIKALVDISAGLDFKFFTHDNSLEELPRCKKVLIIPVDGDDQCEMLVAGLNTLPNKPKVELLVPPNIGFQNWCDSEFKGWNDGRRIPDAIRSHMFETFIEAHTRSIPAQSKVLTDANICAEPEELNPGANLPSAESSLNISETVYTVENKTPGFKLPEPLKSEIADWPNPIDIREELLPVPSLPEELIPEALLPWVKDLAYRMQVPLSFAAVGALVVAGSLIGTRCGIKPKEKDDWLVVPNLWGGFVARPGKLKSPALKAITAPLARLEAESKQRFEYELSSYQIEKTEFDQRHGAIKQLMLQAAKAEEARS